MADTVYRVALSEKLSETYQKQADENGVSIEFYLALRLQACAEHTAQKPIYLNDDQRREIESILSKNVDRPAQLIREIRRLASVKVGELEINLSTEVLTRVKSRAGRRPVSEVLSEEVNHGLERYVGLR